jgi:hypothetical protein
MSACRQLNKNVVVDNEKNVGPPTIALAASKQFPELKKILFHVKQILFEWECHSNGASFERSVIRTERHSNAEVILAGLESVPALRAILHTMSSNLR